MIDSHAHLYEPDLADDLDGVISRFQKIGGTYIVDSGVDPETNQTVIEQASQYEAILPTLGLHPEITIPGTDIYLSAVTEKWIDRNVEHLDRIIEANKQVIAIGEAGLDYYWIKRERLTNREKVFELQRHMFSELIKLATKLSKPMVIHCRDENEDKQAEAEALELIVKEGGSKIRGVFHSFTGSVSYLKDILALGFYVSFNGIVTYKNAENVRELVRAVPEDRILLETDAPLLSPNKRRSMGMKVGEPSFIDEVANEVAKLKGMPAGRLWDIVDDNFVKLFGTIK